MHRRASQAILIHRRGFRTSHRRCTVSQHVAGPLCVRASDSLRADQRKTAMYRGSNRIQIAARVNIMHPKKFGDHHRDENMDYRRDGGVQKETAIIIYTSRYTFPVNIRVQKYFARGCFIFLLHTRARTIHLSQRHLVSLEAILQNG